MSEAQLISWILIVPLLAAVGIFAAGKWPNLREAIGIISGIILFGLVMQLGSIVDWDNATVVTLAEPVAGVTLALSLEPLGMIFALVASLLWPVTALYAIGYMRGNNEKNQTRFFAAFAVSISSAMGIALSANMFTLFLFYEILTLATYPLVTHAGTDKARKAGRTYLGILIGTSVAFLLLAMIWTWQITGTLTFTPGGVFGNDADPMVLGVLLFLYMFGIGKAALMPIHRWLPAAMVAPTPVSALLHAVAVVKAGVFTVVKVVVYIFGTDLLSNLAASNWIFGIAATTIIIASIIALRQDNLKRRLAYSTVSQLSYVIMAAFILAPLSLMGATLHIVAHAFGKITLFFAAGSIYTAAHKTEISQLDGIGYKMPWTMGAFTIGALSMIGIPPLAGFLSKWYMLLGAWQTEHYMAMLVIIISTLLNTAYFVPIIYAAWFKPPVDDAQHGEAPEAIVLALSITATLTLLLFFVPDIPLSLAEAIPGAGS